MAETGSHNKGGGWSSIVSELPPEILRLVPGYLQNRKNDLEQLNKALATGDFKTIKFIGHNIKGNAENYGFPKLAPIGMRLEQAALEENTGVIGECIEDLSRFLTEVSA